MTMMMCIYKRFVIKMSRKFCCCFLGFEIYSAYSYGWYNLYFNFMCCIRIVSSSLCFFLSGVQVGNNIAGECHPMLCLSSIKCTLSLRPYVVCICIHRQLYLYSTLIVFYVVAFYFLYRLFSCSFCFICVLDFYFSLKCFLLFEMMNL